MSKHGRPDWYNITPMIQVHASEDVNELAARLGSAVLYDRRGNVVMYDDFHRGIDQWTLSSSVGAVLRELRAGANSQSGLYQRLYVPAGAGNYLVASRSSPQPDSGSYSAEVHLSADGAEDCWCVELTTRDGTGYYATGIKYDQGDKTLYYLDEFADWIVFAGGVNEGVGDPAINVLKWAFSQASGVYLRAIFNNVAYSLAGIPICHGSLVGPPSMALYVSLYATATANTSLNLYAAIMTINED